MPDTHVVTNQVPPPENYNPATSPVLTEALIREGGEWGLDEVTELGALSGSRQAQRWGAQDPGYQQEPEPQQQVVYQQAPPAPAAEEDPIAKLKELAALRDQGILTDQEFADQKAKLLA